MKQQFGDKRRSEIVINTQDLSMEDLIAPEDVVVTLSHSGYIKSQPLDDYRAQKSGGRGKQATGTKEDDFIDNLFIANTHDYILCFSSRGRVYWIKVYAVPQGGRASRGKPIVNLVQLEQGEKINAILPVKEFDENRYIFMATAFGTVKKTPLSEFSRPRASGIIAVGLDEDDYLIGVALTEGKHDVMLFSDAGKAIRFDENDVRPMGRGARGVRGMKLGKGPESYFPAGGGERRTGGPDRDRKRLWQTYADRRIYPPRPRHPGHDCDQDQPTKRQGGRGETGKAGRRNHAHHDWRRADPHPRQ